MAKQASIGEIVKILDHDRTVCRWVVRPALDGNGKPCIVTLARIAVQFPRDGAGTMRVAVTDWGVPDDAAQFVGIAGGYGYDKLTAALEGATVGGVELGDHCDSKRRPTLSKLCDREVWQIFQG